MTLRTICGCLAGIAVFVATPSAWAKNYLVFIMDDVGDDKVGAYAPDFPTYAPTYLPRTPTINSLAANGLRFTRAWATPLCSSTRAAFQTGEQPFRTGIGWALREDEAGLVTSDFTMLAERFGALGHATGLFGKYHIGRADVNGATVFPPSPLLAEPHPSLAGWDHFFGGLGAFPGTRPFDPAAPNGYGYWKWNSVSWLENGTGTTALERTHATNRTEAEALSWIRSRAQPWLAVVAFNAGHSGTAAGHNPADWGYRDVHKRKYRSASLGCLATESCPDPTRQSYQGLVEHMDIQIEALLLGMDPEMLADTLIIVFGDNGTPASVQESVFDVGRGKGTVYENGVRVPLIIADGASWANRVPGPTIPDPGRIISARLNTLDLYNTLYEDATGFIVGGIDSSSFAQCFIVSSAHCGFLAPRYAYTEAFPSNDTPEGAMVAISYGNDTMVAEYDPGTGTMNEMFYDTSVDPFQMNPLVWVGARSDRLRSYFINLHTPQTSWAHLSLNGPVVPF